MHYPLWLRPYVSLLRLGFRLLYNELAWTYDFVANVTSLGQWWQWQRQALPFLPQDGQVLEIAHGTGHMQVELARYGWSVFGLDISPAMGRLARRHAARNGEQVELLRGQVKSLPIASTSLPSLLSTFPAEFIVEPTTLAELYRVLQPGGRLVIVPSAVLLPTSLLQRLMRWAFVLTGQSSGRISEHEPDWPPHARETLGAHGFDVQVERIELARSIVYVIVAQRN